MAKFCFLCGREFETVAYVVFHLKTEHFLSESHRLKLRCASSKICKKVFSTFSSLSRHSKLCSPINIKSEIPAKRIQPISVTENANTQGPQSENDENLETFSIGSSLLKKLVSCGISETKIGEIFTSFELLIQKYLTKFERDFTERHPEIKHNLFKETCAGFRSKLTEDFKQYSTKFKREKGCKNSDFFVSPIAKALGGYWVIKKKKAWHPTKHFVQSTFQYVPILETLNTLFQNKSFKDLYFERHHICNRETLASFCCAENFSGSDFFRKEPNALQIQTFYDDFEITNPLGSKSGIHKVGALYFTIRNLPFQFNSKCANIHLIALFLCKDLKNKNVDFNTILYPIISDIRVLENTGVKVDNIFIKGTLVSVAHDNLAANLCFGFVCSFRADYYCRFCTIHRDEAKHSVVENKNLLRKHTEYNEILSSVPGVTFLDTKTTKGIKNSCEINNLSHYKIFESHNVDVMHDILEGAVPFVLKLFFKKLTEGKYLSITDINDKIKNFNFGYLQNTCIPPKITLDKKCRTSIGLSASQNLCLILHLPFIFFNFYDILPRFWIGVTSLIRIIKVALSSVLKQQHIQSLKDDIELHLKCIIEVYGETLLPKHHFLTHYPSVLKKWVL